MKKRIIYFIFIIFLAFLYQYSNEILKNSDNNLVTAFSNTEFMLEEGYISVWGLYNEKYMTYDKKIDLINEIAKELGLNGENEIIETKENDIKETKLVKKSLYADTSIKILTVESEYEEEILSVENHIVVDLKLNEGIDSVLYYKELIEDILKNHQIKTHSAINIIGNKDGKITLYEREKIIKELLSYLNAVEKDTYETDNILSVYGYTSNIEDYIISKDNKINIDIAFTFDKEKEITKLYLATPLITVDY